MLHDGPGCQDSVKNRINFLDIKSDKISLDAGKSVRASVITTSLERHHNLRSMSRTGGGHDAM